MKKKSKKNWKIIGTILIILFAFVFLFARIVRPLDKFKQSSASEHYKSY